MLSWMNDARRKLDPQPIDWMIKQHSRKLNLNNPCSCPTFMCNLTYWIKEGLPFEDGFQIFAGSKTN